MEILLSSSHQFPALRVESAGLSATRYPSGSAYMTHDLLARGLAELGHDVIYFPRGGARCELPAGVRLAEEPPKAPDIHHMLIDTDELNYWRTHEWNHPRVISCHIDPKLAGKDWGVINEQWIFVSKSLAESLGQRRFVWNGINPEEYIYSETKQEYFLFMAPIDWAVRKGFDIALELATRIGFRLIVAGGSQSEAMIQEIKDSCAPFQNVDYVGDVRGSYKAELLAGAKGLIFPTKINEAFGLVIAEALMSGTPVICSQNGACKELVSPDVGFVCKDMNDYIAAIHNIDTIKPTNCREKALRDFHYGRMSEAFLREYEIEIQNSNK